MLKTIVEMSDCAKGGRDRRWSRPLALLLASLMLLSVWSGPGLLRAEAAAAPAAEAEAAEAETSTETDAAAPEAEPETEAASEAADVPVQAEAPEAPAEAAETEAPEGQSESGNSAATQAGNAAPSASQGPGVFLLPDGVSYVLDAQGRKHSGWLDVPGLGRAYGAPGTGRAYLNGTYEIEGTHYVFDAWGYLAQDQWQYQNSVQNWSYAQESGEAMRQGSREIRGQRYVFDEDAFLRGGRWIFDEIIQSWTYGDSKTALAYRDGSFVIDGRSYDFSRNGYRNDYDYVPLEEMATYRFEVEGDYLYVYDKDGHQITEPFWNESWTIPLHPERHSVHFAGTWREFNAKEMYFHRDGSLARPYEKVGEGVYVNGERGKRIHAIAKGIDVSAWQHDIDWAQVARDDVDFAFVRVGITSKDELDPLDDIHYRYNLEQAAKHGLKTGAYYYSRATTPEEAIAEADYLIAKLDGFKIDFPVVFDMEDEHQLQNIQTPQAFSAVVNAFNERVREAGYHPMLYCNHHWLYYVMDRHALKDWDIWYAYWGPTVQDDHAIWQATSKGVVPGIDKNVVDINFLFKEDLLNLPARRQALK